MAIHVHRSPGLDGHAHVFKGPPISLTGLVAVCGAGLTLAAATTLWSPTEPATARAERGPAAAGSGRSPGAAPAPAAQRTGLRGPVAVCTADVDQDGDLDVLAALVFANQISWWENRRGDGTAWVEHVVTSRVVGPVSVATVDMDGDGDPDVLAAAPGENRIAWWQNTPESSEPWRAHTVDPDIGFVNAVLATDLDGDGDPDVLAAAPGDHLIKWWENRAGDGTQWSGQALVRGFRFACSVHAGDVDGDGDEDVVGASNGSGVIAWWENELAAAGGWTQRLVDGQFAGAFTVSVADVDADGRPDVLGSSREGDAIGLWTNASGDGRSWRKLDIEKGYDEPRALLTADVDGDGDLDVLSAGRLARSIDWWENQGPGQHSSPWTKHTVVSDFEAFSVHGADLDGDGDLDLVGTAPGEDVTWWENVSGDGRQWTRHAIPPGDSSPALTGHRLAL